MTQERILGRREENEREFEIQHYSADVGGSAVYSSRIYGTGSDGLNR
jgi:hypothetical protein